MMQCVKSTKELLSRRQRVPTSKRCCIISPDIAARYLMRDCDRKSLPWFVVLLYYNAAQISRRKQNALFNSALRQSTSIRKDLDQFADASSPSPHLQAQLNASLATFARTIDDYGKLARQEPVQTKAEKAQERLKNFRAELDEYRASFKRIKSANEDIVRFKLPSPPRV